MDCKEVEFLKVTPDTGIEKNDKSRYDASLMTDEKIDSLLAGDKIAYAELFKPGGLLEGQLNLRGSTANITQTLETGPFGRRLGKLEPGQARMAAIVIHHLQSGQLSEENSIKKEKLTDLDRKAVIDNNNDKSTIQYNLSYSNMARLIGRDLFRSRGIRIVPKTKAGLKLAAKREIEMGEKALSILGDKGLLSITEKGDIVNRKFRTVDKGDAFYSSLEGNSNMSLRVLETKTVSLNELFPEVNTEQSTYKPDDKNSEEVGASSEVRDYDVRVARNKLRATTKLILPSNMKKPLTAPEAYTEESGKKGKIFPTEATIEALNFAQSGGSNISPFMRKFLGQIHKKLEANDTNSPKDIFEALAKYFSGNKASAALFGTIDWDAMRAVYFNDAAGMDSERSAEAAKTLPLINVLENFEEFVGHEESGGATIFSTYELAANDRGHKGQQFLDDQSEKKFTRRIFQTVEEQVMDKQEGTYLIAIVADDTGLHPYDVAGIEKEGHTLDTGIDELLDIVAKGTGGRDRELKIALEINDRFNNGTLPKQFQEMGSVFEMIEYLEVIADIRKGLRAKDKTIRTKYIAGADATGSGGVLTIGYAVGRDPNTKAKNHATGIIEDMFRGKRDFGDNNGEVDFDDIYQLATVVLEQDVAAAKADKEVINQVKAIVSGNGGAVKGTRQLSKIPFTSFMYGQAKKNTGTYVAEELAKDIIKTDNMPLIKILIKSQIVEEVKKRWETVLKTDGRGKEDIEREVLEDKALLKELLITELSKEDGVGALLGDILESEVAPAFKLQKELLTAAGDLLGEVKFAEGVDYSVKIVPVAATFAAQTEGKVNLDNVDEYEEYRDKYGALMEKVQEAILKLDDNDIVTIKKAFPNTNSFMVLFQHMTDRTILTETVRALEKAGVSPDGISLIHDEIRGSVGLVMKSEGIYREKITEVLAEVDPVEITYRELKFARTKVYKDREELDTHIDKRKESLTKQLNFANTALQDQIEEVKELRINEGIPLEEILKNREKGIEETPEIMELLKEIGRSTGKIANIKKRGRELIELHTYFSLKEGLSLHSELAKNIDAQLETMKLSLYGPNGTDGSIARKRAVLLDKNGKPRIIQSSFGLDPKKLAKVNELDIYDNVPTTKESNAEDTVAGMTKADQQEELDLMKEQQEAESKLPTPEEIQRVFAAVPNTSDASGGTPTTDKSSLTFSKEEIAYFEKTHSKERVQQVLASIERNLDDIDMFHSSSVVQPKLSYNTITNKVQMTNGFGMDIRKIGILPSEMERLAQFKKEFPEKGWTDFKGDEALKDKEYQGNVKDLPNRMVLFELLAHELDHKTGFRYIEDMVVAKDRKQIRGHKEFKYIEDTILDLRKKLVIAGITDKENRTPLENRIVYAAYGYGYEVGAIEANTTNLGHAMFEFTAIMRNEPEYRDAILDFLYKEKSVVYKKNALQKLLNYIKKLFSILDPKKENRDRSVIKMYEKQMPKDKLQRALDETFMAALGHAPISTTKNIGVESLGFVDVVNEKHKSFKYTPEDQSKIEEVAVVSSEIIENMDAKLSKIIRQTANLSVDVTVNKLGGKAFHKAMLDKSVVYKNTVNAITGVWDENSTLRKSQVWMQMKKGIDYVAMNKYITGSMHAEESKEKTEKHLINTLKKKIKGVYTEEEQKMLHALLSETPIFHLSPEMMTKLFTGEQTLDQAIAKVLAEIGTGEKSKEIIKDAEALSLFYIEKTAPNNSLVTDVDLSVHTKKLSALYSMKRIKGIEGLLANKSTEQQKMFAELHDIAIANKTLDDELFGSHTQRKETHQGNLNQMVFSRNNEVKPVTKQSIDIAMNSGLGWKVLKKPTDTKAGLIYRDVGDLGYQSGVGTNLKTNTNPAYRLPKGFIASENNAIINTKDNKTSMVLTNKELNTLGYLRDPIISLVKAHTHRLGLMETKAIREEIVEKFTYDNKTPPSKIKEDIANNKHLWYIQQPEGVSLADMDKSIRKEYTLSRARSDANGFKHKAHWVRKDIQDFIEGYKEIQIGETGSTLRKFVEILKKAVVVQKIHWAIVAPLKVARDTVANTLYLLSKNIPITTVLSKSKRIMGEMISLNDIREKLLHEEFKNRIKPSTIRQAKIKKLEQEIRDHPLATAHFKGFIQSQATELSSSKEHNLSGIHNDISSLLSTIFRDDKKALNIAGRAVMKIAKFGFGGEDIIIKIANKLADKAGKDSVTPQAVASSLKEMGDHIKDIKDNNDVEAYIQEYLGTPGSTMVAVGSMAVQATDVIGKVIYYEHAVKFKTRTFIKDNDRGPNKAEAEAIDEESAQEAVRNFVDYKMNMPKELRVLEQVGITSFITFTAKIQKVIFESIRDNPLNAVMSMIGGDLMGDAGSSIFEANILDGDIFRLPSPGVDVILPTKIFG